MVESSSDIYRKRAGALRQVAAELCKKEQRQMLIEVAEHYEQLATAEDKVSEFLALIQRADGCPYPSDIESNAPGKDCT